MGVLRRAAIRLRHWVPALGLLWVLAGTLALLQPCQAAFATAGPHPHGMQMASGDHAHHHGAPCTCPSGPGASHHCSELGQSQMAVPLDGAAFPGIPAASASRVQGLAERGGIFRSSGPPAPESPPSLLARYLQTCQLLI